MLLNPSQTQKPDLTTPSFGELDCRYDEQVNVALAGLARIHVIVRGPTTAVGIGATASRQHGKENVRTSGPCYRDDGSYIKIALVAP